MREATKTYNTEMAVKMQQRINEIKAVSSVSDLVKYGIGRCHPLEGNRNNQYAMDLVQPYRLIFVEEKAKNPTVMIIEIVDYH